jgi:putative transcriptional regulator
VTERGEEKSQFGGRLRELRAVAGLTQQQLADKVGLHRVALARLETGESSPSWETALAICTTLGVSCEEFRVAPTAAPKKGPGRPRKTTADATGAYAEEQAGDAPGVNQGPAKKARKAKGK